MAQSRFFNACDNEINRLVERSSNANTKKSTDVWLRVFSSWAKERKVEPELSKYTPKNLNSILCRYFAEIRKQDGSDYEPDCLRVMLAAMDRKLLEVKYPRSIKKDNEFLECRQVLEGKARELRAAGMGKKPNRAKSLTKEEENVLWTSGLLGKESPRTLLNAMFWLFTQHFGWRGRQGQHELKIDDFLFSKDDDGAEWFSGPNGRYVAVGTADGSILIYISWNLRLLHKVPEIHNIFVTDIAFLPDSKLTYEEMNQDLALVSVSVDNTCHLTTVPKRSEFPFSMVLVGFMLLMCLMFLLLSSYDVNFDIWK